MNKTELEELTERVGGSSRLTTLLQDRVRELCKGAAPLVPTEHRDLIDVALQEIRAGKIGVRDRRSDRNR